MSGLTISSVQEYLDVLMKIKGKFGARRDYAGWDIKVDADFCYRGISNHNYSLCPRVLNRELCVVENDCFSLPLIRFQKEASLYLKGTCGDNEKLWMQYAQHFGVPTRLLDFSANPLVALYFSCIGNKDFDGAVWVINADSYMREVHSDYMTKNNIGALSEDEYLDEVFNSKWKEDLLPAYFVPEYIDTRMRAQSSRFLIWPSRRFCLDEYITEDNIMDFTRDCEIRGRYAFKVIVGKSKKRDILQELDVLGINEKTLFPGIDSVGRYVNYIFDPNS